MQNLPDKIKGRQYKALTFMPRIFCFLLDIQDQDSHSYRKMSVARIRSAEHVLKKLLDIGIIDKRFQLNKDEYKKRLEMEYPIADLGTKKESTKSFRVLGLLAPYLLTNEIFFFVLTSTVLINKFVWDMYGDDNDVMNVVILIRLAIMILITMRIYIDTKSKLVAFIIDVTLNIINISLGFYSFT